MIHPALTTVFLREQAAACLLCRTPACSAACPEHINCGAILKSLRFDNVTGAYIQASQKQCCVSCDEAPCTAACIKNKVGQPVSVKEVICSLQSADMPVPQAPCCADALRVTFCGVECENPFFLSSSIAASSYEMVARAFDAGWAGVSFKTVSFQQPEETSPRFAALREAGGSFTGFKNIEQLSEHTPEENAECIRRLKQNYPAKVIIASIMGRTEEEWEQLARMMQKAGADIIECNFSCPHMTIQGMSGDTGQSAELVAEFTNAARKGTTLPILAKMTPNLERIEPPALAAVNAGADGISAINTIKSVMNVNLSSFVPSPDVGGFTTEGGYSGKAVKPIALRFITDIKQQPGLKDVPVSGMGGIETWRDAAEFMALGCTTVQITTAVLQYGYGIIKDLIDGMEQYLAEQNCCDISQIIGRALPKITKPENLDCHTIQYPRFISQKCTGCGRCVVSCSDGGHQALSITDSPGTVPEINLDRCTGCHLCVLVCPTDAVVPGPRVPLEENKLSHKK